MHLRKLFVVASAGLSFTLGAMAQTDAGAPSAGGAKPAAGSGVAGVGRQPWMRDPIRRP